MCHKTKQNQTNLLGGGALQSCCERNLQPQPTRPKDHSDIVENKTQYAKLCTKASKSVFFFFFFFFLLYIYEAIKDSISINISE